MNQNQAIQIASNFCTAIGMTVTGTPTVIYLVPDMTGTLNPEGTLSLYYLPVWQVNFNEAEVSIDDASNIIVSYFNSNDNSLWDSLSSQPAGQAIAQQAATDTAAAALQSAGLTTDLTFDSAALEQDDDPPTAAGHSWFLMWRRSYQGIPFDRQNVNVIVQAESGQLIGLGVKFDTPNPQSTAVTFDRSHADSIANAQIVSSGIQNAVLDAVGVYIVQPSNFWQMFGTQADVAYQTTISRVAYVYSISVPTLTLDDSPASNSCTVYVDAQNGAIIGGAFSYIMSLSDRKGKPAPPVTRLLASANEVRIFRRSARGSWSKRPIAVLNNESKHNYFHLLQHTTHCKNAGPLALANYKIVVIGKARARHELHYIPSTGRIGSGHAWGVVPDPFKAWVQSLEGQTGKKKVASAEPSMRSL